MHWQKKDVNTLKLGQSFEFSLKNEKCAPPKAKKRSLSSLRRQLRRKEKEDWLSSRECWCSSRTLQRKVDLRPKPVYPRKDLWTLRQTMTQFNNGQQTCQRSPLGPVARLFRSETEEEDHQFGLERSDWIHNNELLVRLRTSLGLPSEGVLKMSPKIPHWGCSLNVFVIVLVFVFVVVFLLVRSCILIALIKCLKGQKSQGLLFEDVL